jgi:hypothetical protein
MTVDEGIPRAAAPSPETWARARPDLPEEAVTLQPPPLGSPRDALAVRDMVARLTAAWPAVTETTVEALVASAFDSFRQAKVRAYLPILVERRVRRVLAAIGGDEPSGRQDGEGEEVSGHVGQEGGAYLGLHRAATGGTGVEGPAAP